MLCARAGASAIAAALALSPIHAAAPKPIIDLSKSPAESGKAETPPPQANGKPMIGPFDQQTAEELGGGALALLVIGAGALALSRRKRRREEAEWDDQLTEEEPRDPLFDEPICQHEPATMEQQPAAAAAAAEPSAFAWGDAARSEPKQTEGRRDGESWIERARRGPTPDNPSLSLRTRLKRAAFFDKREREAAAGTAAPVDTDAGLPEALVEERELETS
jgi:hypothetical protein